MSLTLKNLTGFTKAIPTPETGINASSITCRFFPEVDDSVPDNNGESRGFAISAVLSRDISIDGEVSGATGLMAATHVTAITLANDFEEFGVTAENGGGIYMKEATLRLDRDGWKSLSMNLQARPQCA